MTQHIAEAVTCTRCEERKPRSDFYTDKKKRNGLQSWCKVCMSFNTKRHYSNNRDACVARSVDWAKRNPEKVQRNRSRRRFAIYGITEQEFDEMVDSQGGGCAICQAKDRKLVVDHCHDTGEVRGALCQQCNKALGLLADDARLAAAAAKYLEKKTDAIT